MHALLLRRIVLTSFLALASASVSAQAQPATKGEKAEEFKPYSGQEGKDVVWVPTSQALVNKMLDMAKVTASDVHYDLGSGIVLTERAVYCVA